MSTEIFNGPLTGEVDPRLLQGFAAIIALVEKLGQETKKTDEVQKEAKSTWDSFVDSLRETRDEAKGAGEAYTYIVGSLRDVVATVDATVTQMANLSREHERLSQGSEQLHLDFQQASNASGVFVSQLTALNAAGTFASYGLRLTQDQMDAVIKRAGIYSRQSGVEMTQSVQQLTEALAKGEQEGLARFGGGLVSLRQGAGTAADRLALLVTETRGMTGAAATAADEFDRWKESISSLERVAVGEFARGYVDAMHEAERATGSTAHSVEQLGATGREKFEALGHGVAAVKDTLWLVVDAARAAGDGFASLSDITWSDDLAARLHDMANDARSIGADLGYGNGPQDTGAAGGTPVAEGRSITEMLSAVREGFAQDRADLSAAVAAGEQAQDIQTRKRNIAARMAHGSAGGAHRVSRAQLARMAEKAAQNAVAGQEDVLRRQAGELSVEYGGAPDADVSLVNRVTAAGDRAAGLMDQSLAGESIDPALQGALDSLTGVDDRLQAALGRVRGRQQRGTPEEERRRDEERRGAVDPAIEGQRERERQRREADARMEDEQKADQLRQRRETLAGRLGAYSQQEPAEARAARDIRTAWEGATEALGSHIGMLASGQETWGSFWDGIGSSAKKVLSEVTLAEGKAEFARALVSAAALNPAGVALHTAAGLALVGVSAALGGGGASAPAAGGGGSSRAADVKPRDSAASSAQGQNVTINFGAPVIAAGDNPGAAGRYLTRLMREALVREGVRLPNG